MTADMGKTALWYAQHIGPVFPLHSVTARQCSCGKPDCGEKAGKHPRTPHGLKDASIDTSRIAAWWNRWPDANIGLATGAASRLLVLDVDPRNGGNESLDRLILEHGRLPDTAEQITGGGGRHIIFRHPVVPVPKELAPGLDLKGDGGYIVVAPSVHWTGNRYRWAGSAGAKALLNPADPPAWLMERIRAALNGAGEKQKISNGEKWGKGQRNNRLTSLAGTMRRGGFSQEAIQTALLTENAKRCDPPLPESEVRRIAESVSNYRPATVPSSGDCWASAKSAPELLGSAEPEIDFLYPNLLAPGSISEWFSPRGLGKTHVGHGVAVDLARRGKRVLLIDRDNSKREITRRLRAWGGMDAPTLKVLTRDQAPPLTDETAWTSFPFYDYDLVIIDSLDSASEGIGEKDSARPSKAVAPLLDIAHRADGPAILVLGNTIKSGEHSRGSGVIEDRADICFEVRDATDMKPSGIKPWWEELPPAGAGAWAERASRRKRRDSYRLAFVPSKFRVGEEPDPFVLEIDLSGDQWKLHDVTSEVEKAGKEALEKTRSEKEERLRLAAESLKKEVMHSASAGKPMLEDRDGVPFLKKCGLTRNEARVLIRDRDGTDWHVKALEGRRGKPQALFPISAERPEGDNKEDAAAETPQSETPELSTAGNAPISAYPMDIERRKSICAGPASINGSGDGGLFPPSNPDTQEEEAWGEV